MEQRHGHPHPVAGLEPRPDLGRPLEQGLIVGLGELDALGQAGGAGGVELDDIVIGPAHAAGVFGGVGGDPAAEVRPARMAGLELDDDGGLRKLRQQALDGLGIVGAHHQEAAAGVVEDEGDLRRGEPPVDRGEAGAGLQAAHPQDEEIVIALGQLAHPLAGADAGGDQGLGALGG
jgi:hypothetical protein